MINLSTATTSAISSTAKGIGNYFRINEGDTETVTMTVVYNPLPEDESASYRMRLLGINFASTPISPNKTWIANPQNVYQTQSTYIND